jgi:hypothetical protein
MSEPFAVNESLTVGKVVRRKTVEVADLLHEFPAEPPAVLEEAQRLANEQTQGEPDGVFAGVLPSCRSRWTGRPPAPTALASRWG